MPIVALAVGSIRPYESRYDPDKGTPQATKWFIHTLDSRVIGHVRDKATTMKVDPTRPDDEVNTTFNAQAVADELFAFGVTFEKLMDPDGNELECRKQGRRLVGKSYQVMHDDVLGQIPRRIIQEMAEQVSKDNDLGDEDLGNSDGPFTQSNSSQNTTA